MLVRDGERVHVDAVLEPALFVRDGHIVPAHLSLPHETVFVERPVLQKGQCEKKDNGLTRRTTLTSRP